MGKYENKSEVQLILCWISDDQIFRMVFWSTSLRSIFGTYAKFGLDDFLDVSRRVRPSNSTAQPRLKSGNCSCLPPLSTSTSLSTKNDSIYFYIYGERHGLPLYYIIFGEHSTYRYSRLNISSCLLVLVPSSNVVSLFSYGGIHIGRSLFKFLILVLIGQRAKYFDGAISFEFQTSTLSTVPFVW